MQKRSNKRTMSGIIVRVEVEIVEESSSSKVVSEVITRLGCISRNFSSSAKYGPQNAHKEQHVCHHLDYLPR